MKKILLAVFSGTGNTLRVAEMIGTAFEKNNCRADICDITKASNPDISQYDIIGLGYPVYAFNAPKIFLDSVGRLNPGRSTVFIFKTSGEPWQINNSSSHELKKLLRPYNVLGEYHFLMPYNIIFRFPDSLVKQMLIYAGNYSDVLVSNILRGRTESPEYSIFNVWLSFLFRIQRFGALLNSKLYRVDNAKCRSCGQCARNCPAGNITMKNGSYHFSFKCQMCMRCSFHCPSDAISIGFLNFWKVNGPFNFASIMNDPAVPERFITEDSRGFYKAFIGYFKGLDEKITLLDESVIEKDCI